LAFFLAPLPQPGRSISGMGIFQTPPLRKGRRCLPLGLVAVAIAVTTTCLIAQSQFAFASQLQPVSDGMRISTGSVPQVLSSNPMRLASSAAVRSHIQLGASAASPWQFRPGCILLLCVATAGLVLAPRQQECRSRGAKARCTTARWSVAGFDAGPLPGLVQVPDALTQGSAPAPMPTMLPAQAQAAPAAAAAAAVAPALTPVETSTLSESGVMPTAAPAQVAASGTPARQGLVRAAMPSFRVGAARCARRCGMIGKSKKAARLGQDRSARRAVGARLQQSEHVAAQHVPEAPFDPSRLRRQLQVGLQLVAQRSSSSSGQSRSFKLQPAFTGSVYHSRELPFSRATESTGIIVKYHDETLRAPARALHSCMLHNGGTCFGPVT